MGLLSDLKQKVRGWLAREEGTTMERGQSEETQVRKRYRSVAERLVENTSLRDELDDDQAQRLLDWGSHHLKKIANETAELDDQDAANILEAQAEKVSGVMRQVNGLARAVRSDDRQALSEHIAALRRNVDGLLERGDLSQTEIEQTLSTGGANSEQVFEKLMDLLGGEEE